MKNIISEFELNDMLVTYVENGTGKVGMEIIPKDKKQKVKCDKKYEIAPLIQVSIRGAAFAGGFANGHTMRDGQSTNNLKYDKQLVHKDKNFIEITTILKTSKGHIAMHVLTYNYGAKAFRTKTIYQNESDTEISIEMLSSFSIGAITPFIDGDAENSLVAHKIRSCWSAEGRLDTSKIEQLQLEPSWSHHGIRTDKFGQTGSMPVRKFFPFIAVEEIVNKVTWAAQIACASSWQIELFRRDDALCVSGGLADYDFGHWMKKLKPHEKIETPEAIMTVGNGGVDDVSQRLLTAQEKSPIFKNKLPVLFNEFCTTWGKPSYENIEKIVNTVKNKGVNYFIIDAGWFADKKNGWDGTHGDWLVSPELFPYGLGKTVELINKAGMIPGIWFEFETCGFLSQLFNNEKHLLKRNGYVITSDKRRFLDMRDAWVKEYLADKVIGMIKKYGFKYIKVDYNESMGIGCDGAESLGEGLRQNTLASQAFFKKIREEISGIVIENCSSGGHRLEPSMMSLCDMASFSDAHECKEIPIIAANMHRVIQPGKSQIWAVLRKNDSLNRIVYSIANTFLGIMCLSGDICDLNDAQRKLVDEGITFYNSVSHIISDGITKFYGTSIGSYRHPEGWQCILRYSDDQDEALAVVHTFGGVLPDKIVIPLNGNYKISNIYGINNDVHIENNLLIIHVSTNFNACSVHLLK